MKFPLAIRLRTLPVRLLLWAVWKCFRGAAYVERSYWDLAYDMYTESVDKALREHEAKVREITSSLPLKVVRTTVVLTDDTVATLRAQAVHAFELIPHLQARFDERLRAESTLRNVWPN